MYDIITIGDTATDIFFALEDKKNDLYSLDTLGNWLRLRYGRKITVQTMNKVYGAGNAGNVAVGLARLGFHSAIVTSIGADEGGKTIRKTFKREKIAAAYLRLDESRPTNMSVIIDYANDRTILAHHEEREYVLPKMDKTKWLYFSSIRGEHAQFQRDISAAVKNQSIKLAINPGSQQLALGKRYLLPILLAADVLFVDVEEAEMLTKKHGNKKKLLKALAMLGPRLVVMTDGQRGSYCFDGSTIYFMKIFDFPVVEKTGCGDAYASGFMGAIMAGKDVPSAMRWGSVNAGHAAMEIGSHAGLLKRYQLENFLEKHQWPKARVI